MKKQKAIARQLKQDIPVLWLILKAKETRRLTKVLAGITVGYALSPIDLIPDFIPILGFLDDLIILPSLVYLTLKTIPSGTIEKYRGQSTQVQMRKNWKYAIPIVVFYILLVVIIVKIFF